MSLLREPIDAAFFDRLQKSMAGLDIQTFERRHLHWNQVNQQPAVLYVDLREFDDEEEPDLPPKWHLQRDVLIYAQTESDPTIPASTTLNPFVDAVEKACEYLEGVDVPTTSSSHYYTTLGGLVAWARIRGPILRGAAHQEQRQLLAAIPIEIFVP